MAALMAATLRHMHIKKPSSQTLPLSQIAKLLVALSLVGAKHDQKTPKSKNDVPPFLVARDVLSLVHVCRGGGRSCPLSHGSTFSPCMCCSFAFFYCTWVGFLTVVSLFAHSAPFFWAHDSSKKSVCALCPIPVMRMYPPSFPTWFHCSSLSFAIFESNVQMFLKNLVKKFSDSVDLRPYSCVGPTCCSGLLGELID